MTDRRRGLGLGCSALALLFCWVGSAQAAGELIPAESEEGSQRSLALERHDVSITIHDGFAITRVEQTFKNDRHEAIEATYRFPVPRGASVAGCSVWIAGKEVVGEVVARDRARQLHALRRAAGQSSTLVEKRGSAWFEVRVTPIAPRSSQRIRLIYYQPMRIDQHVGRYVYPLADGNTGQVRALFGARTQSRVTFDVRLHSSAKLADVATPGWKGSRITKVSSRRADSRRIRLEARDAKLDRDFVVYWRLAKDDAARLTLLPTAQDGQGHFLLTLNPGLKLPRITGGIDWAFVLDVSGSMRGPKMRATTEATCQLLRGLAPADRFSLIAFNGGARSLGPAKVAATRGATALAARRVRGLRAGGGTNIHVALSRAFRQADPRRTTAVVLVTDGVANVGPREHAAFRRLLRELDLRVFVLQIGNSANQPLLDRIAHESGGFQMDLSTSDLVEGRMLQARAKLTHQALSGIEVTVEGEGIRATGLSGVTPSLYAGEQLRVFGRYRGSGPARVTVRARRGGQALTWTADVTLPAQDGAAPEVARMWALARIEDLEQERRVASSATAERLRKQVLALALGYSLVTEHTSLIVIPEADLAEAGIASRNKRRLARERAAQRQRPRAKQRTVAQRRARPAPRPVRRAPVSNSSSSSSRSRGGGGAFGPLGALFSALLAGSARRRRRAQRSEPQA